MSIITIPDKKTQNYVNSTNTDIFSPENDPPFVVSGFSFNDEVVTDKKLILEVIVHEEDGIYWAEVPRLPGCYTQADTIEELEYHIIEAINSYLESFEDNDPKKPNYQIDNFVPSIKHA